MNCRVHQYTLVLFLNLILITPAVFAKDGKALAQEFCQACHLFTETEQAGNIAPPLLAMKERFRQRQRLFEIIYDPAKAIEPDTMMPPFGRNHLLDKEQINAIIDFLYTL